MNFLNKPYNRYLTNHLCLKGKGFTVLYDGMRIYIKLTPHYLNRVKGLCGTYNLQSHDDFKSAYGIVETDVRIFSDSYKLEQQCTTPTQVDPCDLNKSVSCYNAFYYLFHELKLTKLIKFFLIIGRSNKMYDIEE
jgi:hypothetical protein